MTRVSGTTQVFPVVAWPVEQVKAPAIYNAYFTKHGIDAVCVPMCVAPDDYVAFARAMMRASNVGGLCISIPHKPMTLCLADVVTQAAATAGAANAMYRNADGQVVADMIDGEGFVRALDLTTRSQFDYSVNSALVVGCGGVGSAIAASLAGRGIAALGLIDIDSTMAERLASSLRSRYPGVEISTQAAEESRFDLMVNGTPLGMQPGDRMPFSLERAKPTAVIADCGMKTEMTELLRVAQSRGHPIQRGKEMLFEQAPLYMDRFGWPGTTADEFRALEVL